MIASVAGALGEAHAGAEHDHLGGDRGVARVHRCARDPQVERGHQEQPGRDDQLRAEPHGQLGAEDRGDRDEGGDRQQAHAG
jgi:hypothetical protein